jgi:hypothetical protein
MQLDLCVISSTLTLSNQFIMFHFHSVIYPLFVDFFVILHYFV